MRVFCTASKPIRCRRFKGDSPVSFAVDDGSEHDREAEWVELVQAEDYARFQRGLCVCSPERGALGQKQDSCNDIGFLKCGGRVANKDMVNLLCLGRKQAERQPRELMDEGADAPGKRRIRTIRLSSSFCGRFSERFNGAHAITAVLSAPDSAAFAITATPVLIGENRCAFYLPIYDHRSFPRFRKLRGS